ncbi:MAG TPA: phosphonate metabolism protein/1,5-bisphosphokinase (PRPP-forming) PhnN [Rhizobiales bacterium]|nr:phosphonate metabolism protein/1,5-bisphosphokinase (PRPP-forming) PhnN [Hyphomicrobiales bacterium]
MAEQLQQVDSQAEADGALIVLVGPSGSGKDSVLDYARAHFADCPDVAFIRRAITRPKDHCEDHQALSLDEFVAMKKERQFALSWGAHELQYGVPRSFIDDLKDHPSRVAVVNGSRKKLDEFRALLPRVDIVCLSVKSEELARRLSLRGRENTKQIQARLERNAEIEAELGADTSLHHLDNSGPIKIAGERFVEIISRLRAG